MADVPGVLGEKCYSVGISRRLIGIGRNMKTCVLIPVHNEVRTIGYLVQKIKKKNLDVVVVDDGSQDNSGQAAKENGAFVLKHQAKLGKGYSLREGFLYAIQNNYDGVITMDGDGQHDVDDLGQFVNQSQKNDGCIITGNRMNNSRGMPFVRFLTNRIMSGILSLMCRQNIPDSQCGYRYISTRVLKDIDLTCDDFEIESEVLIKASKKGFKIYSVPVKTIYEDEYSKIHPVHDTIRFITYLIKESKSPKG